MIPGKQYKPEDFVEAAWRRRWVILVPFVLISVGTFIVARMLPDRFQSSALLLIVPQQVPENFVRPTITTRIEERLAAMQQEILSRTRLENIIQEFDLYPVERKTIMMEEVVESMRTKDIRFSQPRRGRADSGTFTISFEYRDPRIAMQVTDRLAALFIRENMEDRAVLADQTDQFLQSQLKEAERELKERERRLEDFRRANPGLMPQEMQANQQALQNAQIQLQGLQESITRDRDQQLALQRQLSDLAMAAAVAPPPEAAPTAPMTYARQLENAKTARKALQLKLKEDHPDIKALDRTIRELEAKASTEALEQPVSGGSALSPADATRNARLSDLQTQAVMLDRRINQHQQEETKLLTAMTAYRQRLESAPRIESQLSELMRDYTTLQMSYQTMLTKTQEARVSANLERRQIGEQFKVIDSPRMPQRPTSPNRFKYNTYGALAGLALGLALAALLEYRDTSLRTEDDVVVALSLPVLALVPTMITTRERRRQKRMRLLLASSGLAAVLLCIAALAWKLRLLNEWMW